MGITIVGAVTGFLLGELIYIMIQYTTLDNSNFWRPFVSLSCMLVVIIVFWIFFDYSIITASAMFGAYCFFRGWGIFIEGSYPNEFLTIMITNSN